MSVVRRSERGYIIADTVLVMSAKQPRETTSYLNTGDKRIVCMLSDRKTEAQKEFSCCSCFDTFRHTYTVTCQHSYCKRCLRKMFQSGLQDRSLLPVKCCGKRIDQRLRRDVLSMEECTMFENILEEIESPHKMYWYDSQFHPLIHLSNYHVLVSLLLVLTRAVERFTT